MSAGEGGLRAAVEALANEWDRKARVLSDVRRVAQLRSLLAANPAPQQPTADVVAAVLLHHQDTYQDAPLIHCMCGERQLTITEHVAHGGSTIAAALGATE